MGFRVWGLGYTEDYLGDSDVKADTGSLDYKDPKKPKKYLFRSPPNSSC